MRTANELLKMALLTRHCETQVHANTGRRTYLNSVFTQDINTHTSILFSTLSLADGIVGGGGCINVWYDCGGISKGVQIQHQNIHS